MSCQLYAPLFTQMETTLVIHRGTILGGLQKPSIRFGEDGKLLSLLGLETNILDPVGLSLYRLSFPGSYFKLALK